MKTRHFPATQIGLLALTLLGTLWWTGCVDQTGPRWVQRVDVGPDSLHLAPGESGVLRVFRVLDQNGDELPEDWFSDVVWTNVTPWYMAVEPLENGVSVTALERGIGAVRAELGRDETLAPIYIHPPGLDRIEIEPPSILVSTLPGPIRARAHLFDASGVEMEPNGFRLSWEVADTTIAYVSNWLHAFEYAIVHGRQVGETKLRLRVGDTIVSANVTVIREPLAPLAPDVTTLSSSSLEVTWAQDAGGGTDGYRVYRSTSSEGTYTHIASPGEGLRFPASYTTYVDTGLNPGTTYFYQVETCHKEEGCSERSPPGSGTTAGEG